MTKKIDTKEEILKRDFSEQFVQCMKNRIVVSHHKYGWASDSYPELLQAYKSIQTRLDLYLKTGNTEYLVDVANFAMLEFLYPCVPEAKFEALDSDKSPGITGGKSYKEMMEELEDESY